MFIKIFLQDVENMLKTLNKLFLIKLHKLDALKHQYTISSGILKKNMNFFFFSFNFFFFKKFKFIGKGYKIKKVKLKKSFQLYFGYSHKVFLISGGCQLRKLTKYKLFLISNSNKKINRISLIIKNIKKLNFFTKRGLRAIKQKIFKRPGKKSTY